MPPRDRIDIVDAFSLLGEQVRRQASHPDMSGYRPHSKQMAFHSSDDYLRLYLGGNRAGKTHGGVIEDLWWATGTHPYLKTPPPPVRIRVCVTDFILGLGEVMLPKFKALARSKDLKGGSWDRAYNQQNRKLTFANGSEIQFMSYEQDLNKFAGTSQHAIHFDEEPPKDIYNECAARVIDTDGKLWVTMTPVDGITWVYDELFDKVRNAPDKVILIGQDKHIAPAYRSPIAETTVVEVGTEENPFVSAKARERFFATLDDDERSARSQGQFVAVGGKVFPEFSEETHVINMIDRPAQYFAGWEIYTSTDHGWNNPTAWLWHAVSPDGVIITFWEHYKNLTTIPTHSAIVKEIEKRLGIAVELRVGDPAMGQHSAQTGTSVLQDYALQGLFIMTDNIPKDPSIGIAKMHQYFELRGREVNSDNVVLHKGTPTWFITKNCVNTIKEIRNLTFDKYESAKLRYKHNKKEVVQKKNDHSFDSMKYFATSRPDLAPERSVNPEDLFRGELAAAGSFMGYTGTIMPYDKALLEQVTRQRAAEDDISSWEIVERFS